MNSSYREPRAGLSSPACWHVNPQLICFMQLFLIYTCVGTESVFLSWPDRCVAPVPTGLTPVGSESSRRWRSTQRGSGLLISGIAINPLNTFCVSGDLVSPPPPTLPKTPNKLAFEG